MNQRHWPAAAARASGAEPREPPVSPAADGTLGSCGRFQSTEGAREPADGATSGVTCGVGAGRTGIDSGLAHSGASAGGNGTWLASVPVTWGKLFARAGLLSVGGQPLRLGPKMVLSRLRVRGSRETALPSGAGGGSGVVRLMKLERLTEAEGRPSVATAHIVESHTLASPHWTECGAPKRPGERSPSATGPARTASEPSVAVD